MPAKKKLLPKSQLLGLVELPLGFTPFTQASMMTCCGRGGEVGMGSEVEAVEASAGGQAGCFPVISFNDILRGSCFHFVGKETRAPAE